MNIINLRTYVVASILLLFSCQPTDKFIPWEDLKNSPVLPPEQALHTFQVEEGFEIELVASEPLIHDPVAMEFDPDGNIWVVEMKGYMMNIQGTLEDTPNGSIKKLTDTDGDGLMDSAVTILDSLVLPRALKLIYGGLLYAEPPNLWFSPLDGDQVMGKELVDSAYAVGGNVEHQPNGLMLGLDNWIYNAKSNKRYRRKNGKWVIEASEYRGQWGISQTQDGLLVYNTNSNQLRGDLVPPSNIVRNKGIRRSKTTDIALVADQRVYPIRPTSVNRGYSEGMLDSLGRLKTFTAASGPVIYLGESFGPEFYGNAFVPEPSANLIKRNILTHNGIRIDGKQAGQKEFVASTDERFRPVNLFNGPDGNLYVTDMYRGVIQHIAFITNYLKKQSLSRNLDTPIGLGRIYRIKPTELGKATPFSFNSTTDRIAALGHPNIWVRLTAQQLLSEQDDATAALLGTIEDASNDDYLVHALWTLEALGALEQSQVETWLQKSTRVKKHWIRATRSTLTSSNVDPFIATYHSLIKLNQPSLNLEIALALGDLVEFNKEESYELASEILKQMDDVLISEALVSSFNSYEKSLPESLLAHKVFASEINAALENKIEMSIPRPPGRGSKGLYDAHCMTCHGEDGKGIQSLGPPLAGSEWVTGDPNVLIAIVLYGMEGPIEVNEHLYEVPEIAPGMPGIRLTESLGNSNVTAILNYIRTHWGNMSATVSEEDIQAIRVKYGDRELPFKMEDFN